MSDWWTYRPEDFLLFSPRAYWRLFERSNLESWPWQIPMLLLGAAMLVWMLRRRPWSDRAVAGLLALAWAAVGLRFIGGIYAEINWLVAYAVPLFVGEGVLMAWFCIVRRQVNGSSKRRVPDLVGLALLTYAIAIHPLVPPLAGRPIEAAEVIGIAPDPGAIATLGYLSMVTRDAITGLMLAIPLLWCMASAATLLTMGTAEGWIPLTAAMLALTARLWPRQV
jgi:hypothetical protein